jgi:hypothetical protein
MTIKVIVELKAHPGQRDELRVVFERMLAVHGSNVPVSSAAAGSRRSAIPTCSSRSLSGSPSKHVMRT